MYTYAETAYDESFTRDYDNLWEAIRDACSSLDQETNEDGTSNIAHIEITGPSVILVRGKLERILAGARAHVGESWESYYQGVAQGIAESL